MLEQKNEGVAPIWPDGVTQASRARPGEHSAGGALTNVAAPLYPVCATGRSLAVSASVPFGAMSPRRASADACLPPA